MKYFVAYTFFSRTQHGFGNVEIELTEPIKTYADVNGIVEWLDENIKDVHGEKCKCVVLNYIPLEG